MNLKFHKLLGIMIKGSKGFGKNDMHQWIYYALLVQVSLTMSPRMVQRILLPLQL